VIPQHKNHPSTQHDETSTHTPGSRDAITRLPEIVPGYAKAQGYQIAGFFWNQGEHDASEKFAPE